MILLSIDVGIRNLAYIIIKIEDENHFILEWNLMSRYIDQHEDRFLAQAIQDSAYISHPVPFTAQDFQSIFDEILS